MQYSFPATRFICLMLFASVSFGQKVEKYKVEATTIPQFIAQYGADMDNLDRVYIFKDSPEYYSRMNQFDSAALTSLDTFNFDKLNASDRVDYLLIKRNITKHKNDISEAKKLYEQLAFALPFAENIRQLQVNRRRGKQQDGEQVAHILQQAIMAAVSAKNQLQNNKNLSVGLAKKAVDVVEELRKGLTNTYSFYDGYDPMFTWWVKKPYQETDSVLGIYSKYLKSLTITSASEDKSGIIGNPIGADKLKELLTYEMIPYSAEELVGIANREFAWCDAEMLKLSREMGFGNDWKKVLDSVKQLHVAPGKQPELINKLAEEAIAFLEKNDLVTVPALAKESWRMNMLTVEQQKFAPFFLGGESILVAYPTDAMDEETKAMSMRSNNYGFAHATVFHELIPGHNLQFFMNRRYKTYRSVFSTPFSSEGWALYWEMLLWDKGFNKTPAEKAGALFWRMHRCARIIFSLNYHLGKWTPQQCIDFLVDRVGHERFSATSEVRRSFTGGYGPLYQIAYMMGGLQLRALHGEMVETGKMTDKQFHDAFLHENTIPIEMFRAIVTGQNLPKDATTKWRFADGGK